MNSEEIAKFRKDMCKVDPFSDDYYQNQLKDFTDKLPKENTVYSLEGNEISLMFKDVFKYMDGYMYSDLFSIQQVPVFYIDNTLWMSITPMEIQSHYIPIYLAKGKVGVAGLGLGYYVQSILDKEEVSEVIVYEVNSMVIEFYLKLFGTHPKLTIINKDIRELKNESFDFFYTDIYKELNELIAIDDMYLILSNNDIKRYHYWTQELMLLSILQENRISSYPEGWEFYRWFIAELYAWKCGKIINLFGGEKNTKKLVDYGFLEEEQINNDWSHLTSYSSISTSQSLFEKNEIELKDGTKYLI